MGFSLKGIIFKGLSKSHIIPANDPFWSNVVLLMPMTVSPTTDAKGHSFTTTGTVVTSTEKYKWPPASAKYNGTGRITSPASADWNLGATYTVEGWFYPLSLPPTSGNTCRPMIIGVNGFATAWVIQFHNNGRIVFGIPNGVAGSAIGTNVGGGALVTNQWQHVAITRSGGIGYIFVNGVLLGTAAVAAQTAGSVSMNIGYDVVATVDVKYNGYINDLRITKGVARYTASFTPPTAPFPNF